MIQTPVSLPPSRPTIGGEDTVGLVHEEPMRTFLGWVAGLGVVAVLCGCPDPDAEFGDFVKRHQDIYGEGSGTGGQVGVGGGCAVPAAGEVDGEYLFALVAKQSPGKPAPLKATLTTADGAAGLEFSLSMQPLNADDRVSEVGSVFTLGPFAVNGDGTFDADWGTISVPPETNPLTASELVAEVRISGKLCPGDFFCGPANGDIVMPAPINIDGSDWTMESLATFMEPPKVNCAGDLADPL